MTIPMTLPGGQYAITVERGALARAGALCRRDRRALIVTDSGVPEADAAAVAAQCARPTVVRIPQGEESKCLAQFEALCRVMLREGFTRSDCVVAVGGGVVGDLAGFVAASYMRGVDFYNIPTTLLSQVDSSIGGKVAVDLDGIKNILGAFYQPKAVVIDPDTLDTLPPRQLANGMAEAVKMALTLDGEFFALFEAGGVPAETVITRSLLCKKRVVEQDEREAGLRRVLNFGHTIGHAIETVEGLSGLYHGECVALGMLPMCSEAVCARLIPVLGRLGLPTHWSGKAAALNEAARHDKKFSGGNVTVVTVPQAGTFAFESWTPAQLSHRMEAYFA